MTILAGKRTIRDMDAFEEPRGEDPATVLVVDDNEANRNLAKGALEDEGYRVILATGGAAGIETFEREHPDCVLLDVRMPDVDGFAACNAIRRLPGGTDTPVLFLTALRDVDTFDEALKAGADDFLTKPVRPGELVVRVDTALKMRRMRTELRGHYELLKHQRDDLLRLQLQKERLVSFLVHDLKNPVNSMDLHAQLLLREPGLSERAKASATQIRQEARKLVHMIMNLLDISKGDEGKLVAKRTEVDMAALIRGLVDDPREAAGARGVRLAAEVECERWRVDEDLLRRVVMNLLDNALRHAPPDTAVTVSTAVEEGALEVRVADQGPGVPLELRERIFDPFMQVQGSATHSTRMGRGLGLAFCKIAVEAHGGTIWVEDATPGAVFCLRIPPPP
jgi:signal transduction histidine kinase